MGFKFLKENIGPRKWRSQPYRNQSIDFLYKSMDWFLYDRDPCHERVKVNNKIIAECLQS